jgi:CDGSH-type Zn-finger protein/uncharacterized Fe-S cluster protein YjdI
MDSKTLAYDGADATVTWDKARCIHVAACVHGLPEAFDTSRRRWIDPDAAAPADLLDVVCRCPTGALHLRLPDGTDLEPTPDTAAVTVAPDGPLFVRGDVTVQTPDGTVLLHDTRVALCRCGLSSNKPLCDNSHRDVFADPGLLAEVGTVVDAAEAGATVTVTALPDGPLRLEGPFTVTAADGTSVTKPKAGLCRCGQSQNKPFCDGSHRAVGFQAP